MALNKSTTSILLLVTTLFIMPATIGEITCPELVTIEEGGTEIVSCSTMGKTVVLVYWYTGDPAISSPILRLEDGKPGGTEYGRGHYNISRSGAMIITNAEIIHEAVYTTLIYFQDETRKSVSIEVKITISPWPPCPLIDVCIPCEECSLAVNNTGKLTCSIRGTRPMIPLKWIIKTQNGVRILEHPPIVANDVKSATWNSSVEISYDVSSCNQEAILQCTAEDNFNLLNFSKSSVRIYTANCTEGSLDFPPGKTGNFTLAVAVLCGCIGVILMILMILLLICVFRVRGRNNSRGQKDFVLVPCEEPPPSLPKAINGDELSGN